MKVVKNKWMLSCNLAAQLIEKRNHVNLKPVEYLQLLWHNKVCHLCKTYQKQSDLLNLHIKKNSLNKVQGIDTTALEERILQQWKALHKKD